MDGDLIAIVLASVSAVFSAVASVFAARQVSKSEHLAKRDYLDVLRKVVGAQRSGPKGKPES